MIIWIVLFIFSGCCCKRSLPRPHTSKILWKIYCIKIAFGDVITCQSHHMVQTTNRNDRQWRSRTIVLSEARRDAGDAFYCAMAWADNGIGDRDIFFLFGSRFVLLSPNTTSVMQELTQTHTNTLKILKRHLSENIHIQKSLTAEFNASRYVFMFTSTSPPIPATRPERAQICRKFIGIEFSHPCIII